jgi:hypothetical protein
MLPAVTWESDNVKIGLISKERVLLGHLIQHAHGVLDEWLFLGPFMIRCEHRTILELD